MAFSYSVVTVLAFIHPKRSPLLTVWARGLFSESTEVFHYDDILSVESSSEMFIGVITIKTDESSRKISGIPRSDLSIATKMIQEQVTDYKKKINPR